MLVAGDRTLQDLSEVGSSGRALLSVNAVRAFPMPPSASKRTKLGVELEQSANKILAQLKEDLGLLVRRIILPSELDLKRIAPSAKPGSPSPPK